MTKKHASARRTAPLDLHKNRIESEDHRPKPGIATVSLEGPASIDRPEIEVIDGPSAMAFADELAFMEEALVIVVAESTDQNSENPILVAVNGRNQFIFRGVPTVVKRKYVERLARAKLTNFRQDLAQLEPEKYNKMYLASAVRYPFSIEQDTSRGRDWLRKILAEPA